MLVTCAGILVVDLIAASLPRIPNPGELVFVPDRIEMHIGGHAGNVSIDLRKLGLEKGSVSVVSTIGNDLLGSFLEKRLKEHGLVTHLFKDRNVGTSRTMVIIVKNEDRRFIADIGANWYFRSENVKSVIKEEEPLVFYTGGTGILGDFDKELAGILEDAKKLGCLTFVDPVTPFKYGWKPVISALKHMDIFHCNIDEAKTMTGKKNSIEATRALLKKGAKLVVVSLGQEGLIAMTQEKIFRMPAFNVHVIDPTGAGDAFCSGVIRAITRVIRRKKRKLSNLSPSVLQQILLEGEATGALCVTMVGTTTAVERKKVETLLNNQGENILKRSSITNNI